MKVIDLLNKIAKGEEVPKKIKYKGAIYTFDYHECEYMFFDKTLGDYGETIYLSEQLLFDKEILNDEVEIIEENKKIEKIDLFKGKSKDYVLFNEDIIMSNKINELIDEVNKLKGDK